MTAWLYAEHPPRNLPTVTFPSPYDGGFTFLLPADSQSGANTYTITPDVRDPSVTRRVTVPPGNMLVLPFGAEPGYRSATDQQAPGMHLDLDELSTIALAMGEPALRSVHARGTPILIWGPGTSAQTSQQTEAMARRVDSTLIKVVGGDGGTVLLAGRAMIPCPGSPETAPARGGAVWPYAAIAVGLIVIVGAMVLAPGRSGGRALARVGRTPHPTKKTPPPPPPRVYREVMLDRYARGRWRTRVRNARFDAWVDFGKRHDSQAAAREQIRQYANRYNWDVYQMNRFGRAPA